jgi:hypothetical protein
MTDTSKLCADFLRNHYLTIYKQKIKASHAHELVAAFFGYKSHAALLSDQDYPISALGEATILAPAISLMEERISQLKDFPFIRYGEVNPGQALADYLLDAELFKGEIWPVWKFTDLKNYISDRLLFDEDSHIMDELSGTMAETNAEFSSFPEYELTEYEEDGDTIRAEFSGVYDGEQLEDKPFSGDTIEFDVEVLITIVAGRRCFSACEISAGGRIKDDYWDGPDDDQ